MTRFSAFKIWKDSIRCGIAGIVSKNLVPQPQLLAEAKTLRKSAA